MEESRHHKKIVMHMVLNPLVVKQLVTGERFLSDF